MCGAKRQFKSWLYRAAAPLMGAALLPAALRAQACPLCYQSAASSSAQFIGALKNGIFVLIVPSFLICAGIAWVTYRKRNLYNEEDVPAGE